MPDHTEYETGARHPVEKTQPDDNEKFSQDAAANKVPPSRIGNSELVDDFNEKTRHAEGQNPSPAPEDIADADTAIAERSKDATPREAAAKSGAMSRNNAR